MTDELIEFIRNSDMKLISELLSDYTTYLTTLRERREQIAYSQGISYEEYMKTLDPLAPPSVPVGKEGAEGKDTENAFTPYPGG